MRIEAVSAQADMMGRFKVSFSDGSVMKLYKQTVQDFLLYSGRELTQQEFALLQEAAKQMSAKMRAVRIISAGSVSKQDLQQRLIQKGEDASCAKQAVTWLEEMDLLDDEKTAQQIVERCIAKGYGLARAKQALYEKRIPKQYWQSVLEEYPSQIDAIQNYVQTHLKDPSDPKARKKVIDALIRKGHSYHEIRFAMDLEDGLED